MRFPLHPLAWLATLVIFATIATPVPAREALDLGALDLEALVEAGEVARGQGKYDYAVQAFEQAYALTVRDELLLYAAQAHEQIYRRDGDLFALSQSVAHYRRYLSVGGKEHATASRALAELEARLALAPDDETPPVTAQTRLVVMAEALGAKIQIDGGPTRTTPYLSRIAPGKHRVKVRAPGYVAEERHIVVPEGRLTAVKLSLAPQPAKLWVSAAIDAEIRIDGKLVAVAPLEEPLAVEPGRHHLAVTLVGFEPHARVITLERGTTTSLSVDLDITDQRVASWVMLSTGWAALGAGIGFGIVSVIKHREGRDLLSGGNDNDAPIEIVQQANAAFDARDDFRIGSGIAGGVGLGLLLVGGGLFVLDEPDIPDTTVAAVPLIAPGFGGGSLEVRF